MFSGFTASQGSNQTDFGEQMMNTVASQSIRRMFSQCDSVEVDISCFPSSKLMQGNIDSFKMKGKGLVIKRQFQVEEMSFETDAIAVDFGSVLRGQIRLKQPTQAIAQVKLSEEGINRAFNADLVKQRLEDVSLTSEIEGVKGPVSFAHISIKLLSDNKIEIQAKADVSGQRLIPIVVQTTLAVERRRRILFTEPQFQSDLIPKDVQPLAQKLTVEFVTLLNNMIDLDRFDLDGVEMRINRVEIQPQGLLFSGYAQVNHFPGGK